MTRSSPPDRPSDAPHPYRGKIRYVLTNRSAVNRALGEIGLRGNIREGVAAAVADDHIFGEVKIKIDKLHRLHIQSEDQRSASIAEGYFERGTDGPVIHNALFELGPSVRGAGSIIFHHQVLNAENVGVVQMITFAARSDHYNGYYTWARLGYDAPLPASRKAMLPSSLSDNETVLDLMDTEEGRNRGRQKLVAGIRYWR